MIGISSCLAGCKCTYCGGDNFNIVAKKLFETKQAVLICPEVLGGLPIPRTPCEIIANKVIDINGVDRTREYYLGAKRALEILKQHDVEVVLLKANSPSCGKDKIYDGTFSHTLVAGNGIASQLFQENGIAVFNENEIVQFLDFIERRKM